MIPNRVFVHARHLRRKRKRQICARANIRLFRFLFFYFLLRASRLAAKGRESRDSMYAGLSFRYLSPEKGRKDIGIVNHVRGQVYGSSDTAIAYRSRSVPGVRGKRAKREKEKKKERDSSRARVLRRRILEYRCSDTCDSSPVSLFVLCELANRRWLYLYLRLDLNTSHMYARPKYYYVDRKPRVV